MPKTRKIFVLDSNVILQDSSCIDPFDEHDIVIPIPVPEELDQFKKGGQIINYSARRFVRELDRLCSDLLPDGRMPLGSGKGTLAISLDQDMHPDLRLVYPALTRATTGFSTSPTTPCCNTAGMPSSWSVRMSIRG